MNYLIDTNVISETIKPKPNKQVLNWLKAIPNQNLYLSVLSLGEIHKGIEKLPETQKKQKLRLWVESDLQQWFGDRILPIDQPVAETWGHILANAKRSLPAIDSLLMATAVRHQLCVVTRNMGDFECPGVLVINPWIVS